MSLTSKEFSSSKSWDGGSILIHGINNTGKTRTACAIAAHEAQHGKVYVLSFTQEMGYSSAAGMGLDKEQLGYQALYEADGMEEWDEFMNLVEKQNKADGRLAECIVLDSMKSAYDAVQTSKTGGERPVISGKNDSNEWPTCHLWMGNRMTRMRKLSKWLVVTCPSDSGVSQLKEVETGIKGDPMVVPDLNGKMATACATWFNLIGYLMADSVKKGKDITVQRNLSFTYSSKYYTRQRMPGKGITEVISVPEGNPVGAWIKLRSLADAVYSDAYTASHVMEKK